MWPFITPTVFKPETMKTLWTPVIKTSKNGDHLIGLSWFVTEEKTDYAFGKKHRFYAAHTGGAVGASSVLLIYPRKLEKDENHETAAECLPQGIVVAILCNMQNVGMSKLALDVAKIFERLPVPSNGYRVRKIMLTDV